MILILFFILFLYAYSKEGEMLGCEVGIFNVLTKKCDNTKNVVSKNSKSLKDIGENMKRIVVWRRSYIQAVVLSLITVIVFSSGSIFQAIVFNIFLATAFNYFLNNFYAYHLYDYIAEDLIKNDKNYIPSNTKTYI